MNNQSSPMEQDSASMIPKEFRNLTRRGVWTKETYGVCEGYVQANLAIIPNDCALEFLAFCLRNPQPCPVVDVTEPGSPHPVMMAPEADLRTDLPKYRIYRYGKLKEEVTDITPYWSDDLVSLLLGCSFTFEYLLRAADIPFRHTGAYLSGIRCVPAGRFSGPMVVSGWIFKGKQAVRAIKLTSRYPVAHGAPVHIGDPAAIGIRDIYHPEFWHPPWPITIEPDEVPVFWGCGITPQAVAMEVSLPLMITHAPAHMFITDRLAQELAVL